MNRKNRPLFQSLIRFRLFQIPTSPKTLVYERVLLFIEDILYKTIAASPGINARRREGLRA